MNHQVAHRQVMFWRVTDNGSKLRHICETIIKHFFQQESVLIGVGSAEVATYVDQLLWRLPEDSFIPHVIAHLPVKDHIVITTEQKNLNQARILFNLRPQIASNIHEFHMIYDLLDLTHPDKERAARQRQAAYRAAGCAVIER